MIANQAMHVIPEGAAGAISGRDLCLLTLQRPGTVQCFDVGFRLPVRCGPPSCQILEAQYLVAAAEQHPHIHIQLLLSDFTHFTSLSFAATFAAPRRQLSNRRHSPREPEGRHGSAPALAGFQT